MLPDVDNWFYTGYLIVQQVEGGFSIVAGVPSLKGAVDVLTSLSNANPGAYFLVEARRFTMNP